MQKISMFATENDTNKWALCVDGYFGLFDTEAAADAAYAKIDADESCYEGEIDNTPFGSCVILPPRFKPRFIEGCEPEKIDKLSQYTASDIEAYIDEEWRKWRNPTPKERAAEQAQDEDFDHKLEQFFEELRQE